MTLLLMFSATEEVQVVAAPIVKLLPQLGPEVEVEGMVVQVAVDMVVIAVVEVQVTEETMQVVPMGLPVKHRQTPHQEVVNTIVDRVMEEVEVVPLAAKLQHLLDQEEAHTVAVAIKLACIAVVYMEALGMEESVEEIVLVQLVARLLLRLVLVVSTIMGAIVILEEVAMDVINVVDLVNTIKDQEVMGTRVAAEVLAKLHPVPAVREVLTVEVRHLVKHHQVAMEVALLATAVATHQLLQEHHQDHSLT